MPGHEISTAEMVSCVDREMRMRAKVYPRWVSQGKMTQEQADLEGARMMAVRQRLVAAEAMEQLVDGLIEKVDGALQPSMLREELGKAVARIAEQYPLP